MTKTFRLIIYRIFKSPYYKIKLGKIGSRAKLIHPKIEGHKRIFIGSDVYISDRTWLACHPLTGNNDCKLIIGDGTYVGRFCHFYATSKIEIGKKVLIADKVYIADNMHGFADVKTPVIDQQVRQTAEVMIGDGAWLGESACIIGARVGKQSVVGANSVVTKDIPDYCVAVGSPAKIIKRFSFDKNEWLATNENGDFIK